MDNVRQRGFTLFEMLVALAIAALLLSVGVPSYTDFVRNANQVTSSNEMLASLHFARDLAITRNVRVTVCPSSDGASCDDGGAWNQGWIVFVDINGDRQVDGGETIERAVAEIEAPSVESTEFGDFLIYRPNGRVMVDALGENTGELTFCDIRGADHARVVIIDISGRPRVAHQAADGGTPTCPALS
jgi:type IV fimbrial biogenesis protein FimT